MYEELREQFIRAARPFAEGAVDVFEQTVFARTVKRASLVITALGV